MRNTISSIVARDLSSGRVIDIDLQGRNLIITGVNGSGKTRLLDRIHSALRQRLFDGYSRGSAEIRHDLEAANRYLEALDSGSEEYRHHSALIRQHESQLASFLDLKFSNVIDRSFPDDSSGPVMILNFEAARQANIRPSNSSRSASAIIGESRAMNVQPAHLFEEYLVSQKAALAYAESPTIGNDKSKADRIASWFVKLESDLRALFEDETLSLVFSHEEHSFYIKQEGKGLYKFQQLSSGFSSVLSIYAELFMRMQVASGDASEAWGIVIIDEIDAHLHVSLQRKIFAFLTSSFPRIQFIVSTHSPFIVSSVSDAIIYDLSNFEQVDDLSMYSYESILEGLFGILPISDILREKVARLATLISREHLDYRAIEFAVSELAVHEDVLDSECLYHLRKAKVLIAKHSGGLGSV